MNSLVPVRLFGVLVGSVALLCAETIHFLVQRSQQAQVQAEASRQAATIRARLEGALNGVLYLDSGLAGYLAIRHGTLNSSEIDAMLMAILQKPKPYVRNIGISVGYRVTYIYPLPGNEKALGLDYRTIPEQYVQVKKVIDTRSSVLTGPVQLVQGGEAIIHRTPVFVSDKFWGLVSTLVDTEPLYESVGLTRSADGYGFALKGRNGMGDQGEVFFGNAALFTDPAALRMPITVPGGMWVLAVKPPAGATSALSTFGRAGGWALSLLLAYLTYLVLHHRREMSRLALHDSLTGLPNRMLLRDRIDQAIFRASRTRGEFSIVFIDLDHFKSINDTYGHKAGDAVLKTVAERLIAATRNTDTVARWGGDELLLVLEGTGHGEAQQMKQALLGHIERPVAFGPDALRVSASFGIAAYPADGETMDELLKVADGRMYADKNSRKKATPAGNRKIQRTA